MVGIIEGVATTAATKIIGTAISSAGTAFFQKLIRLKKIDSAIKTSRRQSDVVDKAISDFEYVIGAFYGELTEDLEGFLRELSRSGLIGAMAETAILKKHSDPIQRAFLQLHSAVVGETLGDPKALYGKLMVSLETSFEYLAKDKAIAFLIQSATNQLEARLDSISEKLDAVLAAEEKYSHDDVEATLQKLLPRLANSFKDLPIETHRGLRKKDIQHLYTPSRLRYRNDDFLKGALNFRGAITHTKALLQRADLESVSYQEFRGSIKRAIVLGDPGGGKSTLCQYLCYDLAKQSNQSITFPDKANEFLASVQRVPIRVVLRSFENARSSEPQLGIFSYIFRDLQESNAALEGVKLLATLKHVLVYGRAVLAFDGLDEILDTGKRREFVDLVVGFCDQFPLCPVLVTSRIVGYEDAPLPEQFEEFTLEKFAREEIREYLIKFLRVVTERNKNDAEKQALDFLIQTERNAGDLRQNPLMLGLMAYLFAMTGDVPSNRPEIYKECATLMFEKWDQNRDIRANIPSDVDLLDLFSDIAAQIFGKPDLEDGVSASWIKGESERYFKTRYESREKAFAAAKAMAPFITGRSWVMSEFGADVYKFTHRTFLEYFYARNLCERYETVAQLVPILKPKIADGQWSVIAHLALQLKVANNSTRTGQALSLLAEFCVQGKKSIKTRGNLVRFTAQALEYLPGGELEIKPVVFQIVHKALVLSGESFPRAMEIIGECCNASPQRRQYVESVLTETIANCFSEAEFSNQRLLSYLVASDFSPNRFIGHTVETPLPTRVTEQVKLAIKPALRHHAENKRDVALYYWIWFQEDFETVFDKFGFGLFARDNRIEFLSDFLDPTAYMIIKALQPEIIPALQLFSPEAQRKALQYIGRQELRSEEVLRYVTAAQATTPQVGIPIEVWEGLFRKARQDIWLYRGLLAVLLFLIYRDGWGPVFVNSRREERNKKKGPLTIKQILDERLVSAIERGMKIFGGTESPHFEFYRKWCELYTLTGSATE